MPVRLLRVLVNDLYTAPAREPRSLRGPPPFKHSSTWPISGIFHLLWILSFVFRIYAPSIAPNLCKTPSFHCRLRADSLFSFIYLFPAGRSRSLRVNICIILQHDLSYTATTTTTLTSSWPVSCCCCPCFFTPPILFSFFDPPSLPSTPAPGYTPYTRRSYSRSLSSTLSSDLDIRLSLLASESTTIATIF